jgi:chromosome segregation ATPase
MITMGGNAEIELIDSMDPFSEGESGASNQGFKG